MLGAAIAEELQPLDYADRLDRLERRDIGLWDVIASADRPGSLDQSIRSAEHNRIERLLHEHPGLRAIAFNGKAASAIGRRLLGDVPPQLTLIDLPSSSAANTMPFAQKAERWAAVARFLAD